MRFLPLVFAGSAIPGLYGLGALDDVLDATETHVSAPGAGRVGGHGADSLTYVLTSALLGVDGYISFGERRGDALWKAR